MNNLKAKLKNARGFTLVEMLIVVAIIAILVAVSIPVVNSSMEKSREATDAANERSAKAAATILYFDGTLDFTGGDVTRCYNGKTGTLEEATAVADAEEGEFDYGQAGTNAGKYVQVVIKSDGTITPSWQPES